MDNVVVEALRGLSGLLRDPTEFFQAVHDDYQETKEPRTRTGPSSS